MLIRVLLIVIVTSFTACQPARGLRDASTRTILDVSATVETDPMSTGGDSADDATLWIDPSDPARSLVIGTNKQRGLAVYDLSGKEIQFLPDGRMNNVDHRDGFPLGDKKVDHGESRPGVSARCFHRTGRRGQHRQAKLQTRPVAVEYQSLI